MNQLQQLHVWPFQLKHIFCYLGYIAKIVSLVWLEINVFEQIDNLRVFPGWVDHPIWMTQGRTTCIIYSWAVNAISLRAWRSEFNIDIDEFGREFSTNHPYYGYIWFLWLILLMTSFFYVLESKILIFSVLRKIYRSFQSTVKVLWLG